MKAHSVVLFHSTAHAIRAEKVLVRNGFKIKMIPTPRQLSSDCGMALRFDRGQEPGVATALEENKVPISGIYAI